MNNTNYVKFHRQEDGNAVCFVKENGKWLKWNNSRLYQLERTKPNGWLGFKGDNGFRVFQLAKNAGYIILDLNDSMI